MDRALRLGDARAVGLVAALWHERRDVGAVAARFLFLLACCCCQREGGEEDAHLAARTRRQDLFGGFYGSVCAALYV